MRIDPQAGDIYVHSGGSFRGEDAGIQPVPPDMRPEVVGVYVGGCIRTGLGALRGIAAAHAHIGRDDPYRGWVCFQLPADLRDRSLRMHELAHIRTGSRHTDAWRAEMVRLGEPIPRRNQRRRSPAKPT